MKIFCPRCGGVGTRILSVLNHSPSYDCAICGTFYIYGTDQTAHGFDAKKARFETGADSQRTLTTA